MPQVSSILSHFEQIFFIQKENPFLILDDKVRIPDYLDILSANSANTLVIGESAYFS
jgi:hypothetical protein